MIVAADDVAFLEERAAALRVLAESTPDLAAELRRIADELAETAAELDNRGNVPPRLPR